MERVKIAGGEKKPREKGSRKKGNEREKRYPTSGADGNEQSRQKDLGKSLRKNDKSIEKSGRGGRSLKKYRLCAGGLGGGDYWEERGHTSGRQTLQLQG